MSKQEFIKSVKDGAIAGWQSHKILPSVSIAQAILESAWGTSVLATEANNLFGIKKSDEGQAYMKESWEVIDNKNVDVLSAFRWYEKKADSIKDHSAFFTSTDWRKDNYKNVIGETNYKKAAQALKEAGYATDPKYPDKLINIIELYELKKYDIEAGAAKVEKEVVDKEEPKKEVKPSSSLPKPYGEPDFYIEGIPVYKDFLSSSLPNYSGYAMTPQVDVVHETENFAKGANAYMHNRYLHNGAGGRSAAWHFTVDSECIFWHIPLNRNGWHAGDGATGFGNRNGIGIEHCENSDGDFQKTVTNGQALIRWINKEVGKDLPVEPHKKYSSYGKNCPSNILPRWNEYIASIGKASEKAPVTSTPKPHEHKGDVYEGTSIVDYLISIKEDSSFTNRKRFAEKHGIKNYSGTALQNMELLDKLREGPSRIEDKKEKSLSTIAQEVIDGKWRNYPDRKRLLEEAGYSYSKVQSEVERIIKGETVLPDSYDPIEKGNKVILNSSAKKYTTGEDIPSKYKNEEYAILDVSKDGKKVLLKEIKSWVYLKDVSKR